MLKHFNMKNREKMSCHKFRVKNALASFLEAVRVRTDKANFTFVSCKTLFQFFRISHFVTSISVVVFRLLKLLINRDVRATLTTINISFCI